MAGGSPHQLEDGGSRLRALFVNENLGGHQTLHRHLEVCLRDSGEVDPSFLHLGLPGIGRRLASASVPLLGRLDADLQPLRAQLLASVSARRSVRAAMRTTDAMHVYSHNAALAWSELLSSVPSVVATDGTNVQNATTLPYRRPSRWTPATVAATRPFERRVYRAATVVVAQSNWAAASIIDDYGIDAEKVRVIRYGIPMGPRPAKVETPVPEIVFIGTTMERKGGNAVVESFRRVLRGRAVLHLVTLEPVPPEEGIEVHNDVRPDDGKLERILARASVFAFPSTIDKSSFALMEAMAAGVASVVLATGGLGELVEDGVSGRVVEPGPEALDAVLLELVEDRDAAAAMGVAARSRAEQLFDASVTTQQAVAALSDAVDRFAG